MRTSSTSSAGEHRGEGHSQQQESDPQLRSEPTLAHLACGNGADGAAEKGHLATRLSRPHRPAPLEIPKPVVAQQGTGLSPFNALTPLDDATAIAAPGKTLLMQPSPTGDMPLISPFGTVPAPSSAPQLRTITTTAVIAGTLTDTPMHTNNHGTGTPLTGHLTITPMTTDVVRAKAADVTGAAAFATPDDALGAAGAAGVVGKDTAAGGAAGPAGSGLRATGSGGSNTSTRMKEWSAFGDRLTELECDDIEEQAVFWTDSIMVGQEHAAAALQRRRAAVKACATLFSPMAAATLANGSGWGGAAGAHAEVVVAEDWAAHGNGGRGGEAAGNGPYQVHCYAPNCSTPVMVTSYSSGLEACMATEQINMLIECNPSLLNSALPLPPYMGQHGQHVGRYDIGLPGMSPFSPAQGRNGSAMKNGRGGNRRGGAANQQINDLLASLSPLANANGLGYPGLSNAFALGPNGFGNGRGGPVMASANGYNLMGGNGMVAPSGPMPPVSRFLGVQWDERRDGWAAYIEEGARRRQSWLPRVFATEEEAARARDRELVRRNKHRNEVLNFPQEAMLMAQDSSMAPPDGYNMEPETANGYESYPPETVDGWANDQQMPGPGGMGAGPGGMASALKRGPPPGALDFYGGGGAGGMGLPYDANAMYGMTQDGYGGVVGNGNKRQRGSSYNGAGTVLVGPKVTSKYRGVVWDESKDLWRAQLQDSGSRKTVGHYETQEDAARAYDMAILREGRKDKTNFPPSIYKEGHNLTVTTKGARGSPAVKVTSQYKGVSWNSACSKWVAVLWDRELKRARHIGSFESEEAAARAYDREAIKMLGADAGLNFRESLDEYVRATGVELRATDPAQLAMGKGSSQFRGVSWHDRSQRWEVRVWGGGKQHFIGSFTDESEAARAYDKAVLRLRGHDARSRSRMNFPLSDYNLEEIMNEPFNMPPALLASMTVLSGSGALPGEGSLPYGDYTGTGDRPTKRSGKQSRRRRDDMDDYSSGDDYSGSDEDPHDMDHGPDGPHDPSAGPYSQQPYYSTHGEPMDAPMDAAGPGAAGEWGSADGSGPLPPSRAPRGRRGPSGYGGPSDGYDLPGAADAGDGAGGADGMAAPSNPHGAGATTGLDLATLPSGGAGVGDLSTNPHMQALISVLQNAAAERSGSGVADNAPGLAPEGAAGPGGASMPAALAAYNSMSAPMGSDDLAGAAGAPSIARVSSGGGAASGGGGQRGKRKAALGVAALTASVAAADGIDSRAPALGSPRYSGGGAAMCGDGGRPASSGGPVGGGGGGSTRTSLSGLTAPAPVAPGTRGKSQYRGVSWCEKVKKWRALLWDGTKQRFLGHYVTDLDAARAYDRALLDLKGPDAKTNFPASTYDNDTWDMDLGRRITSSQYKGVSYNKSLSRWEARLRYNGRTYVIGSYGSEAEAARAHDCASLHLRGPAANFPAEKYPEDELLDAARRVEAAIQGGGESGVTHSELLLSHTTDGADEEGNGGGSRRSGRRSRIMSDAGTGPPASLPAVSLTGLAGDASNPGSQAVTAQVGMCLMAPGDSNSALPTNLQQTQSFYGLSFADHGLSLSGLPGSSHGPNATDMLASLKPLKTGGKDITATLYQQLSQPTTDMATDSQQARDQYDGCVSSQPTAVTAGQDGGADADVSKDDAAVTQQDDMSEPKRDEYHPTAAAVDAAAMATVERAASEQPQPAPQLQLQQPAVAQPRLPQLQLSDLQLPIVGSLGAWEAGAAAAASHGVSGMGHAGVAGLTGVATVDEAAAVLTALASPANQPSPIGTDLYALPSPQARGLVIKTERTDDSNAGSQRAGSSQPPSASQPPMSQEYMPGHHMTGPEGGYYTALDSASQPHMLLQLQIPPPPHAGPYGPLDLSALGLPAPLSLPGALPSLPSQSHSRRSGGAVSVGGGRFGAASSGALALLAPPPLPTPTPSGRRGSGSRAMSDSGALGGGLLLGATPGVCVSGPSSGGAVGPPSLGRGRSQYRGVSWHVVNNKYIARIRTNSGGNTHLGCFDSAHEAAQAYDVAAIALRGPHQAITNFPTAQYLTPDGTLRVELLDLLSKASTPIIPVSSALQGQVKRRNGGQRGMSSSGAATPVTSPPPLLALPAPADGGESGEYSLAGLGGVPGLPLPAGGPDGYPAGPGMGGGVGTLGGLYDPAAAAAAPAVPLQLPPTAVDLFAQLQQKLEALLPPAALAAANAAAAPAAAAAPPPPAPLTQSTAPHGLTLSHTLDASVSQPGPACEAQVPPLPQAFTAADLNNVTSASTVLPLFPHAAVPGSITGLAISESAGYTITPPSHAPIAGLQQSEPVHVSLGGSSGMGPIGLPSSGAVAGGRGTEDVPRPAPEPSAH